MGLYSFLKQKLKVEEQMDEGENMDVGRTYSEFLIEKGEHSETKEEKKKQEEVRQYVYPDLGLLENTSKNPIEEKDVRERALLLKRALNAIGIDITIVDIHISSRFVIYEIELKAGISVKQLKNAYNDIKYYMQTPYLQIITGIPGKKTIGLVTSRDTVELLRMKELITYEERKSTQKLQLVIGVDIWGKKIEVDFSEVPHLLIAGTTGSGKSMFIHSIILSVLYCKTPNLCRLILIDTKGYEFTEYEGVPHLLFPPVSKLEKVIGIFGWLVNEMQERYEKMQKQGVKDIWAYNHKVFTNRGDSILPEILIIIDDFYDLMASGTADIIEENICKLVQMSRAAGIHLIISTQRPSTNVITGLIKANIPNRMAFTVTNSIDSKVILDSGGAEQLLGNGDMLFKTAYEKNLIRMQTPYVSDDEIHNVVQAIKEKNQMPATASMDLKEECTYELDEYFADAGYFIIEKQKAGIGMLQRVFKIGFNRAARIMDQLCQYGVVSEEMGTKPRSVLMTQEEFEVLLQERVGK